MSGRGRHTCASVRRGADIRSRSSFPPCPRSRRPAYRPRPCAYRVTSGSSRNSPPDRGPHILTDYNPWAGGMCSAPSLPFSRQLMLVRAIDLARPDPSASPPAREPGTGAGYCCHPRRFEAQVGHVTLTGTTKSTKLWSVNSHVGPTHALRQEDILPAVA